MALDDEGLTIPQNEYSAVHSTRRDCDAAAVRRSNMTAGKWCVPGLLQCFCLYSSVVSASWSRPSSVRPVRFALIPLFSQLWTPLEHPRQRLCMSVNKARPPLAHRIWRMRSFDGTFKTPPCNPSRPYVSPSTALTSMGASCAYATLPQPAGAKARVRVSTG